MNLDDIVELMGRVHLFEGLHKDQLAWLAVSGEKAIFPTHREIIQKDLPGDSGYLLVSGHAWRIEGPGVKDGAQALGPGTFIGEMAMLIETDFGSTIITDGEVRAIRFRRALMRQLLQDDPSLARHFADRISDRFVIFAEKLQNLQRQFEAGDVAAKEIDGTARSVSTSITN